MRLIPSISPEASVSGQGKQGMTPSGAHPCCSASSSVRAGGGGWFEAGAAQHQEWPRSLCGSCRVSLGSVAVCVAVCHSPAAAGHREPGARAASQGFAAPCAKAAGTAGVVSQSLLQMAAFTIQGCCPSMVLLGDVLERNVWSGSWLMNCPGSDTSSPLEITLKMARKRGGAGFRGRVSAGADSSLERHLSGHIPVLPSPLAGRSITAAAWAPHDPKCRDLGGVLWLQDFIVTTAQREWQQRLGWDMWNSGALALSSFTPSVHCSHGCICRGDSGWGEDGSDTWMWLLCKSTKHEV